MSKKMFSKVIAMVCVAALCLTAVFTGVVSADATATVSLRGYGYNEGATDAYVTYALDFASATEFTAGTFTVTPPSGLTFTDCSAAYTNTGDLPKVYLNVTNGKILFAGFAEDDSSAINQFTKLTLLLKFTPTVKIADKAAGTSYGVPTISSISVTNSAEETYTVPASVSTAAPAAHVHSFTGTSTDIGTGVTTRACSVDGCTEVETTITEAPATTNTLGDAGNRDATITFTEDGDTVLTALVQEDVYDDYSNLIFVYTYYNDNGAQHATAKASSDIVRLNNKDYYAFKLTRNGGIGRMSRNIKGNFIGVRKSDNVLTESNVWEFSIAKWAKTVIANNIGGQNYVKLAQALLNYGYYTTTALGADFTDELAYYTDTTDVNVTAPQTLATGYTVSSGISTPSNYDFGSWKVISAKVTTGFKPKMDIKFKAGMAGYVATVKINDNNGNKVYEKAVTVPDDGILTINDIPTKYLVYDFELTTTKGAGTFTYGFGRYARARYTKDDSDVFNWMMQYSYYLNAAF